jgi:hypothetical protein
MNSGGGSVVHARGSMQAVKEAAEYLWFQEHGVIGSAGLVWKG